MNTKRFFLILTLTLYNIVAQGNLRAQGLGGRRSAKLRNES